MTSEPSELDVQKQDAVRRIAESIGSHQAVRREDGPGWTCRNVLCASKGLVLLTLGDRYRHQSIVAVNDLLSTLRFDREIDLSEDGVPEDKMDADFTYSLLTDLLDAAPAGRSYAERMARSASV
ncbi:hypothetical protein Achl_4267 (plasmid) [Pseudarthrobacter chlorophenolicus A6]|uniref:Uncharacterized protein n=1 Tax=Pseudarthrobacter chlorophenolicus (strain ATCC 700700 / DSM 12829 / CIP 107037 / JCM 12360 / KCTC 9906 / NCIMB 13794 / A6) TaxID=452863 RepID=B8HIH1_PSECP|nr:hypothetical protein [Pseudarthrobacter chlorophenolicus]ACL42218.1 hypothetical protein Achl_4267 [Pseudarthrobacter chlorophenolicus A6]SDQ15041.1 hypothetical protein SAMN04489738_0325 [Pseudarthrobacter chlorophenolicus]